MLKIYNTLKRQKQDFSPIEPGHVRMYVCGMTVYDYCHLGHARVMVAFDMVQRWLRASGYAVTYVRNITDIDDKIIARAVENGETISALTSRFIGYMDEDAAALGVQKPDQEPRATDYVAQMQGIISKLQEKELAYQVGNGDVNYAVRKFPGYGKLSGKSLDDLRAGERVGVDAAKHDPLDFVLWKQAKPGEPFWASPWGNGRPGWHIECSAMANSLLGPQFDIHGGGQDLQFPHHENEIAQSEGANGCTFANYWMHNGFVRVDDEKMSKSLGNFFTIREVLKKYDAEVVRFFILRAHYRSPLNYSDHHLDDAKGALTRLYTALKGGATEQPHTFGIRGAVQGFLNPGFMGVEPPIIDLYAQRFYAAMNDDFNTPDAVAVLFDLAAEVNHGNTKAAAMLRSLGGVLGLLQREATEFLQGAPLGGQITVPVTASGMLTTLDGDEIKRMIAERAAAKKEKNYAEADRIRKQLLDAGIVLEDDAIGTSWRRA